MIDSPAPNNTFRFSCDPSFFDSFKNIFQLFRFSSCANEENEEKRKNKIGHSKETMEITSQPINREILTICNAIKWWLSKRHVDIRDIKEMLPSIFRFKKSSIIWFLTCISTETIIGKIAKELNGRVREIFADGDKQGLEVIINLTVNDMIPEITDEERSNFPTNQMIQEYTAMYNLIYQINNRSDLDFTNEFKESFKNVQWRESDGVVQ
jgi:hypothetical protein